MPSAHSFFVSSPRRQQRGKKKGCQLKTPVQSALAASQPSSCLSIALDLDYRELGKSTRLALGVALYHHNSTLYGRELTRYRAIHLLVTNRAFWRYPDIPYRPWRTTCGFTGWLSLISFDTLPSEANCLVSQNRQYTECIVGGAER